MGIMLKAKICLNYFAPPLHCVVYISSELSSNIIHAHKTMLDLSKDTLAGVKKVAKFTLPLLP